MRLVHLAPIPVVGLALGLMFEPGASASTPEAWQAFRADVEEKCSAALPEALGTPVVYVEPTGTQSYGVALIEGLSPESKARIVYACVYDKDKKTVELTPAIAEEFVRVVTDSERQAILDRRNRAGDNKTVDETGGQ